MNKIILILTLIFTSHSAIADWLEIDHSEIQTTYANPASIGISGGRIKMWLLTNYKKPNKYEGKPFHSVTTQYEFDCNDDQIRIITYSLHRGAMGQAEVIYSDSSVDKWKQIKTGSDDEILWNTVCKLSSGWHKVGEN